MNAENPTTPARDDLEEFVPPPDGAETVPGDEPEPVELTSPAGEEPIPAGRSQPRRLAVLFVVITATGIAAGHTLRQPAFMTANDISRWCTVWSLLERGTYAIDECPWQLDTQDKVQHPPEVGHFYSSKPALISTVIAGMLYPARRLTGVPLEREVLEPRAERWVQKADPEHPGKFIGVLEKPKDPVKWPAYIFYFKPVLLVLNVIPFALFLIFFARVLDRYAANDWSWFFALFAAAFCTYLLPYTQTLNNHTMGAFAAFFALYHFLRIWDDRAIAGWRFAAAGFFAGLTASNRASRALAARADGRDADGPLSASDHAVFPAGVDRAAAGAGGGAVCRVRGLEIHPVRVVRLGRIPIRGELLEFAAGPGRLQRASRGVPRLSLPHDLRPPRHLLADADLPVLGLGRARLLGGRRLLSLCILLTLLTIVGLGFYYLRDPKAWEPDGPLFQYAWLLLSIPILFGLLALLSAIPWLRGMDRPMEALAWMTVILTIVIVAFYAWTPKARNYGGMAQGLRWVMWLIPSWLILLPKGVEEGPARGRLRLLALAALAISAASVGYAMRNPWSHPWILDMMEHIGIYPLLR